MGEQAAQQVLELDCENAAGYVLLSNIYAVAGHQDPNKNVQQQRKERGEEIAWSYLDWSE